VTEEFDARLRGAFLAAATDRDQIKVFRDLAKEHPTAAAAAVCDAIPLLMQDKRERVRESYGIDLANQKWKEEAKQRRLDLVEEILLLMAANTYLVFQVCQAKLDAYANDTSLSGKDWATKVCTAGGEVLEATEAVLLHALTELRAQAQAVGGSDEVELARGAEASRLAGHLATRTSPTINKRLARALDEIRRYDRPTGRARLEALLRELYLEAPDVWSKYSRTDWQMRATRSEVAKKIEQRHKPPAVESDLAIFTQREREAVLKRGRDAGLPPREYELLELLVEKPNISSREAGEALGITPGAVRALKSKIYRTPGVA